MRQRSIFNGTLFLYLNLTLVIYTSNSLAESPDTVIEPTPIQISAGEWPPFLGNSLPNKGTVAYLISDLFYDAGYEVEFVFLPWIRAYQSTALAEYSATAIWMFKEDRTDKYLYSDPVLKEQFVLFHLIKNPFDWEDLSDLSGKSIGGGLGYSYGPAFDQAIEDEVFKVFRQPKVEQNLRMLAAGHIDLYIEEISVAKHTLQSIIPELAELISYHPKPVLENQSFLLFPKSSPESESLIKIFNAQLKAFKQDGRYDTYFTLTE